MVAHSSPSVKSNSRPATFQVGDPDDKQLVANGVDLDTVRRLMGHTDVKMTMRYLHAAPDRIKGAVETLSFGRPIAQNLDSRANRGS